MTIGRSITFGGAALLLLLAGPAAAQDLSLNLGQGVGPEISCIEQPPATPLGLRQPGLEQDAGHAAEPHTGGASTPPGQAPQQRQGGRVGPPGQLQRARRRQRTQRWSDRRRRGSRSSRR